MSRVKCPSAGGQSFSATDPSVIGTPVAVLEIDVKIISNYRAARSSDRQPFVRGSGSTNWCALFRMIGSHEEPGGAERSYPLTYGRSHLFSARLPLWLRCYTPRSSHSRLPNPLRFRAKLGRRRHRTRFRLKVFVP